jgi:DNA-binding response OmpR family regulator
VEETLNHHSALVAVSNPDMMVSIINVLWDRGIRVVRAYDGAEAIHYYERINREQTKGFDLLIADRDLNVLEGAYLIVVIRSMAEKRKIEPPRCLLITHDTDLFFTFKVVKLKPEETIVKPFEPRKLEHYLEQINL